MDSTIPEYVWKGLPGEYTEIIDSKSPKVIRQWADFNLETLYTMGEGIFKKALNQEFDATTGEHANYKSERWDQLPEDERMLNRQIRTSLQKPVNSALQATQKYFRNQNLLTHIPRQGISMCCEQAIIVGEDKVGGYFNYYLPDWAGCYLDTTTEQRHNTKMGENVEMPEIYLPGKTQLSWRVDFELLREANRENPLIAFDQFGREAPVQVNTLDETCRKTRGDGYKPEYHELRDAITRIYTYCFYANCRYGYVITDRQLIVVRIRPSSRPKSPLDASSQDHPPSNDESFEHALANQGLLEYRIIEYNTQDRTKLTVTLALWWLHLLAAIENSIRWHYPDMASLTLQYLPGKYGYCRRDSSPEYAKPSDSPIEKGLMGDRCYTVVPKRRKRKQFSARLDFGGLNPDFSAQQILDTYELVEEPEIDLESIHYSSFHDSGTEEVNKPTKKKTKILSSELATDLSRPILRKAKTS